MATLHVKSNPVANMTGTVTVFNSAGVTTTAAATDLVRPLDWNSAHNQFMTIGGNTAGASTLSGTNIEFHGGNNVTLSGNGQTIVFSAPNQTAFVLSNSNGVSFGTNGSTVTASHNGLTSQSNQAYSAGNGSAAFQTITFADSNGVSFSTGTQGLFATVRTNYAASDHSHGNPSLALTNLSGTTASNSAGLTLSLSAAAPGAGAAISAAGNSVSNGTVVFSNSNGISFGMNGSTITATVNPGAAAGIAAVQAGTQTATSGTVLFENSNGITFGLSGSSRITASHNGITQQSTQPVAVSGQNGSFAYSTLSFSNANGISFGTSGASAITASHNGLTTARASNDAIGLNSAFTAGPLAMTINSSGLSLNAASAAGTTSGFAGNLISGSMTHNTAGLNLSLNHPAWLTTAAQSDHSHGNPTLALTNLSGTTASNSAGLTLSLSAAAPGGAASATLYATGNTTQSSTGTQALSSMLIRGDGGISAGISNGSIVVSGPALTSLSATGALSASSNGSTISLGVGTVTVSATGNTTQASSGTVNLNALVIQGTGGASVGVSNGSIVISGATGGGGGVTPVASASNGSFSFTTLAFSNANNVTFGTSVGGIITASVAAPGAAAEQNAINLLGANTAGNTTATGSTIGLSGLNLTLSGTNASQVVISAPATSSLSATGLVSISTNGSTIAIGVPAGTATMWWPYNEAINVTGQQGNATWHFVPLPTPPTAAGGVVSIDRLCLPIVVSNSSNSTGSATLSVSFGMYTRTGSSISLAHSTTGTLAVTYSGTLNNSTYAGIRLLTIPWTTSFEEGRYYVGVASRTTTGGTNCSISQMLRSELNSNFSGLYGANSNRSNQWPLGVGVLSASSSAFPSSVAFSQLDGTGSLVARPPTWFMINGTA